MKNLSKLIFFFPLLWVQFLFASNDGAPIGGRRLGLGGAYAAIRGDAWSLWANPAGITGIKRFEGGLFTESRYLLSEITAASFGAVVPFQQKHFIGASASTFGFGAYRRNEAGISYATTLYEFIHLGVKFNVLNLAISNYGSVNTFFANVGLMANVSKRFTMGFWTQNANQAKIGAVQEERLATILNGGVTFHASDKLILTSDLVKYLDYPMGVRSGFEYQFVKQFCIRAGYSTSPSILSAGAGFRMDNLSIDFANSYHERLGYTPHLSLTLRLGNRPAEEATPKGAPEKEKVTPKDAKKETEAKPAVSPAPAGNNEKNAGQKQTQSTPTGTKPKTVLPVTASPQEIKAAKKVAQEENKKAGETKPDSGNSTQPK